MVMMRRDISKRLLLAAREVNEVYRFVDAEQHRLKLKEIADLLCFYSALFSTEGDEAASESNVIPFARK